MYKEVTIKQKKPYTPRVGDKVYHRNLHLVGIVTMTGMECSGDSTSTVVNFSGEGEKEVSTHLLKKID